MASWRKRIRPMETKNHTDLRKPDPWSIFTKLGGVNEISSTMATIKMSKATFFSHLQTIFRCWFDATTSATWCLCWPIVMNILKWLMIGVRITNAPVTRWGTIKGFDDIMNSVGMANNTTLASASTALFAASAKKGKLHKLQGQKVIRWTNHFPCSRECSNLDWI